ncbi:MAG: single-stranded DNA-binding protein [Clostridia bacterium]|nr:single-stranded DNA-binding protein [Clostridia bacterium]
MSNFNLNKVILGGRLTADPELKQTQAGVPVVSFTIAVNRRFQSKEAAQTQTDFFNIVAWRATAEFVSRFFHKGSAICISGSIQNRSWTDQQGQKRYATDIVADEAFFVDSRTEMGAAAAGSEAGAATPSYSSDPSSAPSFEDMKSDDDLPF